MMDFSTVFWASVAIVVAYVVYKIFEPRKNIFDTMPKYRPNPIDEMPDSEKMSQIIRCSKPDDQLEIVYSKEGIASRPTMTITQLFDKAVKNGGDRIAFAYEKGYETKDNRFEWCFTTWKEYGEQVNLIAKAMIAIDIDPFDIVNLLGFCTAKYIMIQIATIYCGALPAGIYTTSQSGGIKYITNLCKSKAVFVDTKESLHKYYPILKEIPSLRYIIIFRETETDQNLDDIAPFLKEKYEIDNLANEHNIRIMNWKEFLACGKNADLQLSSGFTDRRLLKRKEDQEAEQCCNIVYTSGTTGFSKGVMLSHDNIYFQLCTLSESVAYKYGGGVELVRGREDRSVAFLPLSHVAGQIIYIFSPLWNMAEYEINMKTYFARYSWKKTLKNTIATAQPTAFLGVPRIWEKFYEAMNAGLANASPIKKALFDWIIKHGLEMWENRQIGGSGEIPKLWPFIARNLCDKLIKDKIGFGSCVTYGSGGGVLNKTVRNQFAALNMPILDGYGMSECAGAICGSRMNNLLADSVGPALEGCEIRIEHVDERDPKGHGEICFRGRNCMMGYLFEPEKTKSMFDDNGWLHSGDVGYVRENCVYVTGRIKELLVTSGGENIAPIPVENFVRKQCPALSQVVMCGDGRKYCSVLVTLACEIDDKYNPCSELQPHAMKIDSECDTVEKAMKSEKWHEYIRNAIVLYNNNKDVCASNAARIQYFQILPKDLNIYDRTLSPTMKLRRQSIYEVYKDYIEAMYPNNGNAPKIPVVTHT